MPDNDLTSELSKQNPPLTLRQATRLPWMRRNNKGKILTPFVVQRWALTGRRGTRLKVLDQGGVLVTSERWLREFFAATTEERIGGKHTAADCTGLNVDRASSTAHQAAVKDLAAAGIV